jgi:hypothetical protein
LVLTSSLVLLEEGKRYCQRVPTDGFIVSLLVMG